MNNGGFASKYINLFAASAATVGTLFAGAATIATAREAKSGPNLLTIQNLCKPGSLQTLLFGDASSKTEKTDGKTFLIFQVTPDKYLNSRDAKISLIKTCELHDHLNAGLEKASPMGVPHATVIVFDSKGNTVSTGQTEVPVAAPENQEPTLNSDVGEEEMPEAPINEEDVAVSQQEITSAIRRKAEKASGKQQTVEIVYARDQDHWQLDYTSSAPKKTIPDTRPVLTQLIEKHLIAISQKTWAVADNVYFALAGIINPPTDERLAAADEILFTPTSLLKKISLMSEKDPYANIGIVPTTPNNYGPRIVIVDEQQRQILDQWRDGVRPAMPNWLRNEIKKPQGISLAPQIKAPGSITDYSVNPLEFYKMIINGAPLPHTAPLVRPTPAPAPVIQAPKATAPVSKPVQQPLRGSVMPDVTTNRQFAPMLNQ